MISDNIYELCFKRREKEASYLFSWAVANLLLECIIFSITTAHKGIDDNSLAFFLIITFLSSFSWVVLVHLEGHSIELARKKEKTNMPMCYPICGASKSPKILKEWWKLDDLEHKMNNINTKRIIWTIYGLICGFIEFALLLFIKSLSYQWAYLLIYIGLATLSAIDILVRFIRYKKIKSKKKLLLTEIQSLYSNEVVNENFLRKERARSAVIFSDLYIGGENIC